MVLKEIQVLELSEAIRKRPTMYVGPLTDPMTPTNMLKEALCKALDAGCKGEANLLVIAIPYDGYWTISQNSAWSTDIHEHDSKKMGREVRRFEHILTAMYACREEKEGKRKDYCNTGIVMVTALSETAKITVHDNGKKYVQTYTRGIPDGPAVIGDTPFGNATRLAFKLDRSIFQSSQAVLVEPVLDHLRENAADGLEWYVQDVRAGNFRSAHR